MSFYTLIMLEMFRCLDGSAGAAAADGAFYCSDGKPRSHLEMSILNSECAECGVQSWVEVKRDGKVIVRVQVDAADKAEADALLEFQQPFIERLAESPAKSGN